MADDEGPPAADVIDVAFSLDVLQVGALAADEGKRRAADALPGPYGAVDAADENGRGPLESFDVVQDRSPSCRVCILSIPVKSVWESLLRALFR